MKILHVNVVYAVGSTGKIVYDIHKSLIDKGYESIVLYGREKKVKERNVYKTSTQMAVVYNALKSRVIGIPYAGSFFSTNRIIGIIKREKPDIVHLHCINGHFVNIKRLMCFLKENNIKTVLTLHAEFMHTGSCPHAFDCERYMTGCGKCPYLWDATKSYFFDFTAYAWRRMKSAFEGFNNLIIVASSEWILSRAQKSPITKDFEFCVIKNGIDTENIFKPVPFEHLKEKHKLKDEKILLHVTANFHDLVKGSKYFVELARKLDGDNIKILLVGRNVQDAHLPDNVIAVGGIYDQKELAAYYSMADLFVITSVRETYPTVCIEAVSCGTPVVGFDTGGVKETIPEGMGMAVEAYSVDKLHEAVLEYIDKKDSIPKEVKEEARYRNSKERMARDYLKVYTELYNRKI